MRMCLPAADTPSTRRPVIGVSSWIRVSAGKTDSNLRTTCPASARCSVRAARKIVSPSGTSSSDTENGAGRSCGQERPPHLEPHGGRG